MRPDELHDVEELEISLLLEAVHRHFGYDLRMYRPQPLRRRLRRLVKKQGLTSISALQEKVLHDSAGIAMLLAGLSMRSSVLLGEGGRMKALRDAMVPWLSSCAAPKIWVADCVACEDVFALSVMLEEEKLSGKCTVFATASHEMLVDGIAAGRFPADRLAEYDVAYREGGGTRRLSDYCAKAGTDCVFSDALREHITFAEHNLATDSSFNEFHLIVHPSGLSEFTDTQRGRTAKLFNESLSIFGMLNAGKLIQEQQAFHPARYRTLSVEHDLYLRVA